MLRGYGLADSIRNQVDTLIRKNDYSALTSYYNEKNGQTKKIILVHLKDNYANTSPLSSDLMLQLVEEPDSTLFLDLINFGAKFNILYRHGHSTLELAIISKNYKALEAMLENQLSTLVNSQYDFSFYAEAKKVAKNKDDHKALEILKKYKEILKFRRGQQYLCSRESDYTRRPIYSGAVLPAANLSAFSDLSLQPEVRITQEPRWIDVAGANYQYKWIIEPAGQLVERESGKVTSRFCSGVLISNELFLTAGHCVGSDDDNDTTDTSNVCKFSLDDVDVRTTFVSFNYQYPSYDETQKVGEGKIVEDFRPVREIVESGKCQGYDFAILRLDNSDSSNQYGKVALGTNLPVIGSSLVITQHPDGIPKKFAQGKRVANQDQTNAELLAYDIDTQPGSSGSPVGDPSTNKVVAVHIQGGKDCNYAIPISSFAQSSSTISGLLGLTGQFRARSSDYHSANSSNALSAAVGERRRRGHGHY